MQTGPPGFDRFSETCYKYGIIKTMLTVTQIKKPQTSYAIASYHALNCVVHLIQQANIPERRACLDQLLRYDAVRVCLDVSVMFNFSEVSLLKVYHSRNCTRHHNYLACITDTFFAEITHCVFTDTLQRPLCA